MLRFFLSFSILFMLSNVSCTKKEAKPVLLASCCTDGGRCTGSAYCTACSNCSGCKHCAQNGGSCGVCGGGNSNRSSFTSTGSSSYRSTKRKKSSSSYSKSKSSNNSSHGFYAIDSNLSPVNGEVAYDTLLIVKTSILNVRSGPGKEYPIVVILEQGNYVRCLETSSEDWIRIEVVATGVEGYVFRKNLE